MSGTAKSGCWIGWWRPRPGIAWSPIAEGDSYDDALTRLLDALASVRGGDSIVLLLGRSPARLAQPMGRRGC
jgi:hypothetical protein